MKIKASELKIGDVYIGVTQLYSVISLTRDGDGIVDALMMILGCGVVAPSHITFGADTMCEVERPTLTPAQQHADELLELVRKAAIDARIAIKAQQLLAKIDPPLPPTLTEALTALRALAGNGKHWERENLQAASEIVRRAELCGLLPPPPVAP